MKPFGCKNAMTVDVEDYFQVSAFENNITRKDWDTLPCRVEQNIDRLLSLFDEKNIRATFFTLGWVAERYPDMVRRIVDNGHELASHGWEHIRVINQTPDQFSADITRTKAFLEDISGRAVKGYRAASYSIGSKNLWALEKLEEAGYLYSSSIVPIKHDLYGMPEASRFPFLSESGKFLEIPITTVTIVGKNINCAGGGWFRLFPYWFTRWALSRVNNHEQHSGIFYLHPWEIDAEQPRVDGASAKARFRHYLNLDKTYSRLERLLEDFQWDTMEEVFLKGSGIDQ